MAPTRSRTTSLIAVVLCWTAITAAQNPPASVLLDGVRDPAYRVAERYFYVHPDESASITDADWKYELEQSEKCLKAVDQALAGGVPPARTLTLQVKEKCPLCDAVEREIPLSEVKQMCGEMQQAASRTFYLADAETKASGAQIWVEKITNNQLGRSADIVQRKGKDCVEAIDKATGAGLPDSSKIQVGYSGDNRQSLSEAREMCVYVRDAGKKALEAAQAAEDAEYKPYRDVLSGDKLTLYNSRMKVLKVYGHGGRLLRTPQDYKLSNVWCEAGVNREGAMPMWELACWRFLGMNKVGGPTTKQGVGDQPPSSAFP